MRVMHIIPSAFEYFKDIKQEAFALAEEIEKLEEVEEPVKSEAVTLQYSAPTRAEKFEVASIAPEKKYQGERPVAEIINQFAEYDVVHLHAPFMGNGGMLKKWKEQNPVHPFVITYYRDVLLPDFFAYIFKWYNAYYLPKLFHLADAVTCFSLVDFNKSLGAKYLRDEDKLFPLWDIAGESNIHLTEGENKVKLERRKVAAFMLYQIYNSLL